MFFFFQAEDGIRDLVRSRGLGDVYKRQQSAEFGNYWGPFGDALTKVMEGKSSPEDAVTEACSAMNTANGVEAVSYTHLTLPTSDLV